MSRRNTQDAFQRIVELLNEAMLDDARWPEVAATMNQAVGSTSNALTFGDESPKGDIRIFFAKCIARGEDRSDWVRKYFRDYHATDEHLPRLRALPSGKIVPVAEQFSQEERRTSRTYNEWLVRTEGQKGLHIRLDGPYGSRIAWAIGDPIDGADWSSAQIDIVARVLPQLRQYVRVRSALADAGALGSTVMELLEHTCVGVIQLDRLGRIVEANDSAMELLRQNDGLSDRGGTLTALTYRENLRLYDLLTRALPRCGKKGESGSMLVLGPSRLPRFVVHAKPVTDSETDYRYGPVAALVLIVDPGHGAKIDPELVQTALGLTRTETEIALALAEGRTLRQIAATTDREYNTVRSHVRSIFAKLGVARQFEVAQRVIALSRLPPPLL